VPIDARVREAEDESDLGNRLVPREKVVETAISGVVSVGEMAPRYLLGGRERLVIAAPDPEHLLDSEIPA
jgi:hypothetical protein